jgi:hypothetical protein
VPIIAFNFPAWIIAAGIGAGLIAAWLYWSFAVTKWRIWAFNNVRNVHELKRRAIAEKFIWRDGHILEKTEIRSAAQKEQLKELEVKFQRDDVFTDDLSVPAETIVHYSRSKLLWQIGLMALFIGAGIYLLAAGTNYVAAIFCIGFGGFFIVSGFIKLTNKSPQIVLNNLGLQSAETSFYGWGYISDEEVAAEQNGKYTSYYLNYYCPDGTQHIKIDDFDINRRELDHLLRVYRARCEKKTNTAIKF